MIEWIHERDVQNVVRQTYRQCAMKPRQAAGNQALDSRRDFLFGKIDESVPSASAMTR